MRDIVSPLDGIRSPFGFIRGGVVPFSPLSLFASGEEGAWYEPSTTTAFLSTTDLTPCGYGDACGFLLDKSQGAGYSGSAFTGLGSELVTNGTFDTDVSGWTSYFGAALSWDSGRIKATLAGSYGGFAQSLTGLTVGNSYIVSAEIELVNYNNGQVWIAESFGATAIALAGVSASGINSILFQFVATTTTMWFHARGNVVTGTGDVYGDNISVRELPGNHATQATSSARPILARVPEGGRRNLLERTEEFDDAYWTKSGVAATANTETAPDGTSTAETITESATTATHFVEATDAIGTPAGTYTISLFAKAKERSAITLSVNTFVSSDWAAATFNLLTGVVSQSSSSGTISLVSSSITDAGDGWYRCSLTATATSSFAAFVAQVVNAASYAYGSYGRLSYTGDGTSGIYIWGAQLELGSSATAYQKVVSEYDITEAGVTSLDYLAFDGSDDGMATASIDFTATDKMSVFAGVEKESDAAAGVVAELSANSETNTNVFALFAPSSATNFLVLSGGSSLTITSTTDASYNAPTTRAMTFLGDISGPSSILRLDKTQIAENTTTQGTGNYGDYPLNIGARDAAGTASAFFDGKLFSLIVRGASSTANEISQTETYLANRSGVTL